MPEKAYDINSIQSLDFREGVRTRIQMYLGSDDNEGAEFHLDFVKMEKMFLYLYIQSHILVVNLIIMLIRMHQV